MFYVVLAIITGVFYIISLLLALTGNYKPTIKDIYIVDCIILLWVLGGRIAAETSGAVNKQPPTNATSSAAQQPTAH